MYEDDSRVPDRGPWTVHQTADGKASLLSEDFHRDSTLTISGDFGSAEAVRSYADYLADILTRGCAQARVAREFDDAELLYALTRLSRQQEVPSDRARLLLSQAADELALLQVALAEADKVLAHFEADERFRRPVQESAAPSPFALALQAALATPKS